MSPISVELKECILNIYIYIYDLEMVSRSSGHLLGAAVVGSTVVGTVMRKCQ